MEIYSLLKYISDCVQGNNDWYWPNANTSVTWFDWGDNEPDEARQAAQLTHSNTGESNKLEPKAESRAALVQDC